MSLKFRFTLDGSEMAKPPIDWKGFTIGLRYSNDVRGYIHEYNATIKATEVDFDTLYSKIIANEICAPVDFMVEFSTNNGDTYSLLMVGYIVVSEIEFDLIKRECEFTVTDNSFTASIFQNRKLDVATGQTKSKSGVTISAPPYTTVSDRQGLEYGIRTLDGFAQNDLLEYIVAYITDNQITVDNAWYTSLTEEYVFCSKASLSTSFGIPSSQNVKSSFTTSFDQVFVDIAKLFNLHFALVFDTDHYVFTVITEADRYGSTTAFTISGFTASDGFTVKIAEEKFYTSVSVGCDENDGYNSTSETFFGDEVSFDRLFFQTPYFDWRGRKLSLGGQCNIDGQTLNLQTSVPYGNNNVLYYLSGVSISKDEQNQAILLQKGSATGLVSFSGKYSTGVIHEGVNYNLLPITYGPSTYNQGTFKDSGLITFQVLNRYNLPNSVFAGSEPNPNFDFYIDRGSSYAVDVADRFEINALTDGHIIQFDTTDADNYEDDYQAWSDTYYNWTCQSLNVNVFQYSVNGGVSINVTDDGGLASYQVLVWCLVKINDKEATFPVYNQTHSGETVHTFAFDDNMLFVPYNAGTSVSLVVQMDKSIDYSIVQVTTFLDITQVDGDGSDLVTYDQDTFKGYEINIETVCTVAEFLTLLHDPRKRIALNLFNEAIKYGWAQNLTFTPETGRLTGSLITDWENLNLD